MSKANEKGTKQIIDDLKQTFLTRESGAEESHWCPIGVQKL